MSQPSQDTTYNKRPTIYSALKGGVKPKLETGSDVSVPATMEDGPSTTQLPSLVGSPPNVLFCDDPGTTMLNGAAA